jgi:outer membrane immunogenic protein
MRSRNLLLASVASSALTLASASYGADMPVYLKAAPPVWNWTGFYLGGNVGYSWGTSNSTVAFFDNTTGALLASPSNSFGMDGIIGGGQVGYNWQVGRWVWGLETDIQASGQQGTATFACGAACGTPPVSETLTEKLDWFGTARGRLGFTVTPTVLLYATGGLAYGDVESSGVIGDPTAFSMSTIKAGWTVGGGVEARIVGNWTAKLEYLYMDLGDVSGTTSTGIVTVPATTGSCGFAPFPACSGAHTLNSSFNSGITDNILRVGVNYKFN